MWLIRKLKRGSGREVSEEETNLCEVFVSEGDGSPKVTAAEPWGTCLRVGSGDSGKLGIYSLYLICLDGL